MPVDGVEVRSALARQWGRIATTVPGLDLEAPSRIDGWRNREVVAHLTLQPVLLGRFLETASDRSPTVTLPSNLTGTGGLAQVVDSSARDAAARGRIDFGPALDRVLPSLQAADLAATVEAVQGPILLVDYLVTRCVEAVVHGCDLVDPVVPDRIAEAVAADALLSVLVARAPELEADARALPPPRWIDMATGRSPCSGPLAAVMPVMT
jgi:Mycothiol maleylpyruvate isomerase N-terminal domain